MKKILTLTFFIFAMFQAKSQDFQTYNTISVYAGIQNPNEMAVLDFAGSGPGEYFSPGVTIGVALSKEYKVLALSLHAEYLHNPLNLDAFDTDNPNLHSLSINFKAWINFLKSESRMRFKAGVGIGILPFRYPVTTYTYGPDTDSPGMVENYDAFTSFTASLNSGLVLTYELNEKIDFYSSLTNDFILYHGDSESAILTALNIGISYRL